MRCEACFHIFLFDVFVVSKKTVVYMHLNKVQVVDLESMSAERAKIAQLQLAVPSEGKGEHAFYPRIINAATA